MATFYDLSRKVAIFLSRPKSYAVFYEKNISTDYTRL